MKLRSKFFLLNSGAREENVQEKFLVARRPLRGGTHMWGTLASEGTSLPSPQDPGALCLSLTALLKLREKREAGHPVSGEMSVK